MNVNVYPNPAESLLDVEIQNSKEAPLAIESSDITGKLLLHKIEKGKQITTALDIASFPTATYFLKITSAE